MEYKKQISEIEDKYLSPYAVRSSQSKGRKLMLEPCPFRTEFQRDRDRIIHSKAFRRLKHKTQVFLSPEGDHYRTRLTHTLEVSQIARTISRALRLNEDLTEAIALAHDLGHTPFGHAGEDALSEFVPFHHNEQGVRVVEVLENDFQGMNLTFEVVDGILHHRASGTPSTLEGKVVSFADRIAYINHDIDDALRAGIISLSSIPHHLTDYLGTTHGARINNMIADIVENSMGKSHVAMTDKMFSSMNELRKFNFDNIYSNNEAKNEEGKAKDLVKSLYSYFLNNPTQLPKEYLALNASLQTRVCDYIATMTDRYAITVYEKIFVPNIWKKK